MNSSYPTPQPTLEVTHITVRLGWEYRGSFRYDLIEVVMDTNDKLSFKPDVEPGMLKDEFVDALNIAMASFTSTPQSFDWIKLGDR